MLDLIQNNLINHESRRVQTHQILKELNSNLIDKIYGTSLVNSILYYLFETSDFLYYNRYLKRDHTFKMTCEIAAYEYNLVRRDYMITSFTGLKTFFLRNTKLLTYYRNRSNFFPLTSAGITRKRWFYIFFRYTHFLQHSGSDIRYINSKININSDKHQCTFPDYLKLVQPLNKLITLELAMKHATLSFKTPFYIIRRRRRNKEFCLLYLGLKYRVFGHYKFILSSFLKKYIIKKNTRKYHRRRFIRCKSNGYLLRRKALILKGIKKFYLPRRKRFVLKGIKKNSKRTNLKTVRITKSCLKLKSGKLSGVLSSSIGNYGSHLRNTVKKVLYFSQRKRLKQRMPRILRRALRPRRKKRNTFYTYRVPFKTRVRYFASFNILLRYLTRKRKHVFRRVTNKNIRLSRKQNKTLLLRRRILKRTRGGSQPVNRKGIIMTGRPTKKYRHPSILYTKRQMKYRRY